MEEGAWVAGAWIKFVGQDVNWPMDDVKQFHKKILAANVVHKKETRGKSYMHL